MKPIAVLTSDVHFNIRTLERASKALKVAVKTANQLDVHLIIAGDLHDSKALLRAECISSIIEILKQAKKTPYVLIGNHDLINEKGIAHALEFLRPCANVVESPTDIFLSTPIRLLPYCTNQETFLKNLSNGINIVHQGLVGAMMGHYMQDASAVNIESIKCRVISGHYHERQTIGTWDYIGNPYTLGFGEADHPEKGIQLLYPDGHLEFVPTELPRHQVIEMRLSDKFPYIEEETILWLKLHVTADEALKIKKQEIATKFHIQQDFKLDVVQDEQTASSQTLLEEKPEYTLDKIIDSLENTSLQQKTRLKDLFRSL
jgi:DNA repair exonuclease SbcCD nuclease subunit